MIRSTVALTFVLVLGLSASAQDKTPPTKEQLTGTWKLTKSDEIPKEMVMMTTFAADGTLTLEASYNGEKMSAKGTWELVPEKSKIKVTIKAAKGEPTTDEVDIITLTEAKLVTKDGKGKTDEFEKAK